MRLLTVSLILLFSTTWIFAAEESAPLRAEVTRRLTLDQQETYVMECKASTPQDPERTCVVEYRVNGELVQSKTITRNKAESIARNAMVDPKKLKNTPSDPNPIYAWAIKQGDSVYKASVASLTMGDRYDKSIDPGLRMESDFIIALDSHD